MPPLIDPPPVAPGVLGGSQDLTERLPRPVHPNRRWGLRLEAKSPREQLWWGRRWGIDTPYLAYPLGFGEWAPLVGQGIFMPPASNVRAFTPDGNVEGMGEEDLNRQETQALIDASLAALTQPAAHVTITGQTWQVLNLANGTRLAAVKASAGPAQIEAILVGGAIDGQRLLVTPDYSQSEAEGTSPLAEGPAAVFLQVNVFTEATKKSAEAQHKAEEEAKEPPPHQPYPYGFPKLGAQPGRVLEPAAGGSAQAQDLTRAGSLELVWHTAGEYWTTVL
jgi:hypothetical protein